MHPASLLGFHDELEKIAEKDSREEYVRRAYKYGTLGQALAIAPTAVLGYKAGKHLGEHGVDPILGIPTGLGIAVGGQLIGNAGGRLVHRAVHGKMPNGKSETEKTSSEKIAKKLTSKERKKLPKKDFALPGGRYPIEDKNHARNALSRASQNASPSEEKTIERKVHAKYPDIGEKTAAVENVTDKDRAKKYGRRGAAIGGAYTAGKFIHNMHKAGLLPDTIKKNKALSAGTMAATALIGAGGGYLSGRLAHRLVHGKATGKVISKKQE